MCLICGLKIVENARQINDAINVAVTGPALEKSIHVCFGVFFPNVCCFFSVHPGDGSRTIKHGLIVCRTTVLSCFRKTEAKKIIRPGSTGSAVKRARQHRSPSGTKSMFGRRCLKEVARHISALSLPFFQLGLDDPRPLHYHPNREGRAGRYAL